MASPLDHTKLTFTLNTGAKIPALGFGTWHAKGDDVRNAVKVALQTGYRHIDTAMAYGNEKEVGLGIKDSGIPREDIWVTTKLDHRWHHRVDEAITASLSSLGLDFVDLYMMHWPCSTNPNDTTKHLEDWNFIKTWQEMAKLPASGKARNVGICNFQIINLEKLLNDPSCKLVPAVNQIELHPNHPSAKLLGLCTSKGIHVTAYSCLGSSNSRLLSGQDQTLVDITVAKEKTAAQCLLMWGIQRGTCVIPKSVTPSRIQSNFQLDGWELSAVEMEQLSSLKERFKVCGDGFLPVRVFFDDDE